jgi:hypothetical protein
MSDYRKQLQGLRPTCPLHNSTSDSVRPVEELTGVFSEFQKEALRVELREEKGFLVVYHVQEWQHLVTLKSDGYIIFFTM